QQAVQAIKFVEFAQWCRFACRFSLRVAGAVFLLCVTSVSCNAPIIASAWSRCRSSSARRRIARVTATAYDIASIATQDGAHAADRNRPAEGCDKATVVQAGIS
ncbi:MAG: hypothetical protein J0I63_16720, partial [Thiobacillus sp.]|nr:hypothetical protein [Thiobacillus sp.]